MFNSDYIRTINNELSFHNNISGTIYDRFRGKIISDIAGLAPDSDKIEIFFEDNYKMILEHDQDCCEEVFVDQIDGIITRHVGTIFYELIEKVVTNEECPQWSVEEYNDSMTATFYDLVTSKGRLSFRWKGESNGYYSESVDVKYYLNQERIYRIEH